jgi:hypothetical protein
VLLLIYPLCWAFFGLANFLEAHFGSRGAESRFQVPVFWFGDAFGCGISSLVLIFHIAKKCEAIDFGFLLNHGYIFHIKKLLS